jgi:hypothetical protein
LDQFHRDVLDLLHFSLRHDPPAAHTFFPMFTPEQIRALYEIPREVRERIWAKRARPEYRSLFEGLPNPLSPPQP